MHVAFEEAHGLLPRRVVAEGVVHLRVDQSRNRGGAVGVDHDVAVRAGLPGAAPTETILPCVHDDAVALARTDRASRR